MDKRIKIDFFTAERWSGGPRILCICDGCFNNYQGPDLWKEEPEPNWVCDYCGETAQAIEEERNT